MDGISKLKQERLSRGWSRAYVEAKTEGRIPESTLIRWEEGMSWPRLDGREALCELYGKSLEELGLNKSGMIESGNIVIVYQEEASMSDIVRRAIFSNLGSKLTGLIDLWPKRNYHYEELQEGINRAILEYNTVVVQEPSYEFSRRDALKSMALVPVQLVGGIAIIESGKVKKTDTDLLLKHCAAGITACWYLRRGKELNFVSGLTSKYTKILQPLIYSHSEAYRKASATLLAQNFRLRGSITEHLKNSDPIVASYYNEAIRYALMAENASEQAIANRMMAFSYWRQGTQGYEQALPYAEKAYGLTRSDKSTHRNVQSFTASGLSLCQAVNGKVQDAKNSLTEARDLFDSTMPVPSMYYTESNLLAISADVYQHRHLWRESVNLWVESLATPDISALGSIQARINYAKTEVSRDDIQTRNMDLCIKLLTEAITGATELDSERYKREACECYNLLHAAWPREDAIKRLGEQF